MREGQIKNAIKDAAQAFALTNEPCHLERIRELTAKLENRRSKNITVSQHAIRRFMERSKCKSESKAAGTLKSILDEAEELVLKDRFKAIQLINHDYKDARYFKRGDWLLVVCGNAIVTCHTATAKRWRKLERTEG